MQQQVEAVAHLPISKHAAVIASHAVLYHGHPSNLEKALLHSTSTRAFRHPAQISEGTDEQEHDAGKQGVYLRDVLIGD